MHGGFECTSRIFLCLYYQTEEIACVPFSLIKKCKSITPVPPTAPPHTPTHIFSSFLSHGGICDERALLMWSCRNPFQCQLHRFLCRTASDEFACFKKKICSLQPFVCAYACQNSLTFDIAMSFRCMACVRSPWGCQWNTRHHTCSDKDDSTVGPGIIGHRKVSLSKEMSRCFLSLTVCWYVKRRDLVSVLHFATIEPQMSMDFIRILCHIPTLKRGFFLHFFPLKSVVCIWFRLCLHACS